LLYSKIRLQAVPPATNAVHLAGSSLRYDMPLCAMPFAPAPCVALNRKAAHANPGEAWFYNQRKIIAGDLIE